MLLERLDMEAEAGALVLRTTKGLVHEQQVMGELLDQEADLKLIEAGLC